MKATKADGIRNEILILRTRMFQLEKCLQAVIRLVGAEKVKDKMQELIDEEKEAEPKVEAPSEPKSKLILPGKKPLLI